MTNRTGVRASMRVTVKMALCATIVAVVSAGCKDANKTGGASPTCATCVTVDDKGFTPKSLDLSKGNPGEKKVVTFTRTSDDTCATAVDFPELGIKKDLPLNQPVALEVPVDTARTLTFQCGMGMYKSAVIVK